MDWPAQLSTGQLSQEDYRNIDAIDSGHLRTSTITTPPQSESLGSFSSLRSAAPSQNAWSSTDSFPSNTSGHPTAEQYRSLNARFNEVKRENLELVKNNQLLTAKLDTLAKAYETLTNRIPALLNSKTMIGQKETREANPNVKYWTRQEWTAANVDRVADLEGGTNPGTRGRTRAAQGINVNMKYLEDKEGVPISGHLASDVRRHARAVFVGLAQKGSLFSSWTEADHTSLKLYYSEMAERFEELRLCANDWKAEMIALDIYRTWREQWQKKQKKVDKDIKIEVLDVNMDDTDNSEDEGPQKHSIDQALNEDQRAAKKAKSGNVQDLPAAIRHAYVPMALQHMQAQHIIPNINITPGAPVPAQSDAQTMVPKFLQPNGMLPPQSTFQIVNPLQSSNSNNMAPCLVAMPSNGHPPPPFAFNTPMLTATNAPLNIPRPQPAPKSRRMRPTKSITPRNLCAIDWCKENKGTADDFNQFWNNLSKEEKDGYEAQSKDLSAHENTPA